MNIDPWDREIFSQEQFREIPHAYEKGVDSICRIWIRLIKEGFSLRAIYHDHDCQVDLLCLKDGFQIRYTISLYSFDSPIFEDTVFNHILHLNPRS
jgi:hypothetical protein